MSELVMSELTFYGGGTFIKKGLVEKELHCLHRFRLNRLETVFRQ